jgi:chromosome segregation ATPase
MVVFGKPKENKERPFEELEEFSAEMIRLGKDIAQKLQEKQELETQIFELEKKATQLKREIFGLRERLIKINLELSKLEQRRREVEENQKP